jgi:hypothetical protein
LSPICRSWSTKCISHKMHFKFICSKGNKFHLPNSSDLSVIAIRHKVKESYCTTVVLLFCILQKRYLNSSCTFLYNISGSKRYYDWCRSCLTSLLVSHLDITDCRKFKCPSLGVPPNGISSKLRFAKICHLGKNVKRTNTQLGLRSLITSFFGIQSGIN